MPPEAPPQSRRRSSNHHHRHTQQRPLQTPPSTPEESPLPQPPPRTASKSSSKPSRRPSQPTSQRQPQQKRRQHQHQQRQQVAQNLSDDYLLSKEEDDLYAVRMNYLKQKRQGNSAAKKHHLLPPPLFNFANSGLGRKGQRTILTYNQAGQTPTPELQVLVLLLLRAQLRDETLHLSDIVNEQNPFEMRNMRLNSFIAGTPDLIDHWKVAMLEEGLRMIEKSVDEDSVAWVTASAGAGCSFPMPMDERTLVSLPADKPEISKSQVATEYIQAQRGQQGYDQDDTGQLFQSEVLRAENAAGTSQDMFDRICTCYKSILQKSVEIEYIEKRPETCQAVDSYIEMLKNSPERVVQESLTQNLMDASKHGDAFFRTLVGEVMGDLHTNHKERNFEPMRVVVSSYRKD